MSSPAISIAYALWLRLRWIAFTGILTVAAVIRLFPGEFASMVGMIVVSLAVGPLLNAFTFGPVDLGIRNSGFPTHMMVLPMSTRALVGWPMLFGATTIAAIWILLGLLNIKLSDIPVPIVWPALMLATACAWVQAIGWTPFPSPFARIPVMFVAISPLVAVIAWAGAIFHEPSVTLLVAGFSVCWMLVAYAYGVRGLARARRGYDANWLRYFVGHRTEMSSRHTAAVVRAKLPFRSAFSAQFWHDWRRTGLAMLAIFAFVAICILAVLCIPLLSDDPPPNVKLGTYQFTTSQLALALWFAAPLLIASVVGSDLAKCDFWAKAAMTSFHAVRPVSTAQFVLIKLLAVFAGAATVWAMFIALLAVWAVLESSPLNRGESIVRAAWAQATPAGIAAVAGVLIAYLLLLWRNIVVGMWPTMTGRKWLSTWIAITNLGTLIALGVAGTYAYNHPEIQQRLLASLPWIVGVAVTLKLCAAASILAVLRQQRAMDPRSIAWSIGAWISSCLVLFAAISFAFSPTPLLVAGVVWFVPLNRLAAAPLALHWNRHR
jgi:hypothetical protein